jgi:hypothetical protein
LTFESTTSTEERGGTGEEREGGRVAGAVPNMKGMR